MPRWALAALLLGAIGWWLGPWSPRQDAPPATAAPSASLAPGCPPPPLPRPLDGPLQSEVPSGMPPFALPAGRLRPLAGFRIEARVLSRRDYTRGREAGFSPTDLALGWQRMRDDAVLDQLDISQSSRWYRYRWRGAPPLPPPEIVRSSANMHLIPAHPDVALALRGVRQHDSVRIDGWLVQAEAGDGWRWRSSLRRDDSGAGACELIYVCAIQVDPRPR